MHEIWSLWWKVAPSLNLKHGNLLAFIMTFARVAREKRKSLRWSWSQMFYPGQRSRAVRPIWLANKLRIIAQESGIGRRVKQLLHLTESNFAPCGCWQRRKEPKGSAYGYTRCGINPEWWVVSLGLLRLSVALSRSQLEDESPCRVCH